MKIDLDKKELKEVFFFCGVLLVAVGVAAIF
jgi:hypothetical protein